MRLAASFLQGLVNILFSGRTQVEGDSMLPSLAHRESVFVVRTRFRWNKLRRGDVAVFERPGDGGGIYIKRVVGLPGEDLSVAGGSVYLDGKLLEENYLQRPTDPGDSVDSGAVNQDSGKSREWFNGPDEYFLLGDNRADSNDSRAFGPVSANLIRGRAWFRCWPPTRWRPIARG
ncbi:MAG: signal peptidase I [Chloroflexi bacterium]|nr:signal peptidase I [Chloroflexota bacterium]